MRSRHLMVTFVSIALCFVLGACGNDSSTSSATPSPTETTVSPQATSTAGNAELCAQRDALESSLRELTNINVVASGTSGIQEALSKVRTNLQALRTTARDQYRDQTQALDDALRELETAVTNVDSGGVGPVVTAAGAVATSGQALLDSLRTLDCG
jgi:ABC-type phosphate/phosphonate transport system substrate-binding protein